MKYIFLLFVLMLPTSCTGLKIMSHDALDAGTDSILQDGKEEASDGHTACSWKKKKGVIRITNNSSRSSAPSLVWTGQEYGVAWTDRRNGNYEIYFARISKSGVKQGRDIRITNNSSRSSAPSLVWTGQEYGVAWTDSGDRNPEVYFARISKSGVKQGDDIRITNISSSYDPSLVWTGQEYGVAWGDFRDRNPEIYFTRISKSGVKQGDDIRITSNFSGSFAPSLVWTGEEYGVAWYDYRDGNEEIYFARISKSGVKQGDDIRITNISSSDHPSLVWTGEEYGVAWCDYQDGNEEIYFARISKSGVKQGDDIRITNDSGSSTFPSLVWTGEEYGVAWCDDRDGNEEIYFARIVCK
jgi:predicted RecA/RadA family phage recombinase